MKKQANGYPTLALLVLLLSLGAEAAVAQPIPGAPDPERGAELAAKLCVNCHIAKAENAEPVNVDVPTFSEIANKQGRTAEWLAGKIILPAHPMPTFSLSRADIGHLVAYIQSLRKTE